MLKTPHPVPQEVEEWLCTLDHESLMQVARDAVAYASQALDKEPNAVVLEILESIYHLLSIVTNENCDLALAIVTSALRQP